ncbi:oleate hydratase [Kitasatospora sp. NPDC002227]|uniref:oleate hydratase n=1 Tax=Kitasatospora sp. NPDC002227 TaxID=3154773 RepID=UPI00331AAC10
MINSGRTTKGSPRLTPVVVPRPPHLDGRPGGVFTLRGHGRLGRFGFTDLADKLRFTTTVATATMPYITSRVARRSAGDRPSVIPHGARNTPFTSCSASTCPSPRSTAP